MYYLDTNTCIYFLNGKYESIKTKLLATPPNEIVIPAVVKAELILGAYKSKNRNGSLEKVEMFLEAFEVVPFDDLMTYMHADIRYKTELKGENVGPNDLLIATIVKFHEGILVTNNLKEFCRIEGLMVENWAT